MKPTTVNGVECACEQRFNRFSAWEAHREECDHYE
jgi:hypothetical protein